MTPLFSGKYTASPCIEPKPQVAPSRKKGSQVLESAGTKSQNRAVEFGSQHVSVQDHDAVNEDYSLTIEELLRQTSRKQDSIREPPCAKHALQKADQRSLDGSSSSINTIQSRLADGLGSQGRCNCA